MYRTIGSLDDPLGSIVQDADLSDEAEMIALDEGQSDVEILDPDTGDTIRQLSQPALSTTDDENPYTSADALR